MEKEKNLLDEKNMSDVSGGWSHRILEGKNLYWFSEEEVQCLRNAGYKVAPAISGRIKKGQGAQNVGVCTQDYDEVPYSKVSEILTNAGFSEQQLTLGL